MEGFKIEDILSEFLTDLKKARPELETFIAAEYSTIDNAKEAAFFTEIYRPLAMDFIKKNEDIFKEPRFFLRGIDFSTFYSELSSKDQNNVWDFLRTGLVASYIGDDWMKTIKDIWTKVSGKEGDEIDEILNDTKTKSNIEELFEYFKETRIFKLGMEMLESLTLDQFGIDGLDFTDPAKIIELLKNPDNPIMQRAMGVVHNFVEAKIRSGNLKKEHLIYEMEAIREKFKHSLGKIFQEGIFGEAPRGSSHQAEVLLSSSPDARRARMMARLQRKHRERQTGK
jgi:hypothetical protein